MFIGDLPEPKASASMTDRVSMVTVIMMMMMMMMVLMVVMLMVVDVYWRPA